MLQAIIKNCTCFNYTSCLESSNLVGEGGAITVAYSKHLCKNDDCGRVREDRTGHPRIYYKPQPQISGHSSENLAATYRALVPVESTRETDTELGSFLILAKSRNFHFGFTLPENLLE